MATQTYNLDSPPSGQLFVGDTGTALITTITRLGVGTDISFATGLTFIFDTPTKTTVEKPASFVSDGSDGQVQYETEDGFLSAAGVWHIQVFVEFPLGRQMFGPIRQFLVFPVI